MTFGVRWLLDSRLRGNDEQGLMDSCLRGNDA